MARTQDRIEDASDRVQDSLTEGQRQARRAVNRIIDRASELTYEAMPAVNRLTERAQEAAREGAQWVREGSDRVRSQVVRASDRTVGYVRDEPVRSLMMAAAAGALIFALVRMLNGRADR